MTILVQKFGGTSVGSVERILHVAKIIAKKHQQGCGVIVVVSAVNGETNRLIKLAHEISNKPPCSEYDALLATGEQVSASLLSIALHDLGFVSRSYCGLQLPISTTDQHRRADIVGITVTGLLKNLNDGVIPIVTGFQGVGSHGQITTLGRGGSDMTAVGIAAAVAADECQIYTDVDGIYSCDPRIVPTAYKLDEISIQEMLEMAQSGAKVMQPQAMLHAAKNKTPLRILSSFVKGNGTLIQYQDDLSKKKDKIVPVASTSFRVTGMALALGQSMLMMQHLPAANKQMRYLLDSLRQKNFFIDDFSQTSVGAAGDVISSTWAVADCDREECIELIEDFLQQQYQKPPSLKVAGNLAKLSLIGEGLVSSKAALEKVQDLLDKLRLEAHMTQSSAARLSILLPAVKVKSVAQTLHQLFIESEWNP